MSDTVCVVPKVFISDTASAVPNLPISVALDATVVTSVALGTNLWKLYVCNVVVDSTNKPNPAAKEALAPQLFIVTVDPPTVPFEILMTPLEFAVCVLANALIDTIVPTPLFTSGFAFGKLVSFAIGTKPPTSSTRSMTLASIAAVVAIKSSLLVHD